MGMKAPKDCPPPPVHLTVKVSSGRLLPWSLVISEPKMVPRVRSVLVTGTFTVRFSPFSSAPFIFFSRTLMSTVFSSWKS